MASRLRAVVDVRQPLSVGETLTVFVRRVKTRVYNYKRAKIPSRNS